MSRKPERARSTGSLENRQNLLAGRLKAGDHAAAAELVDMYYEQIYWFMRRLGHSREAGEDLTQETFMQAWHHVGQLRSGRSLGSWLYHIAANVSRMYWRRHKHSELMSIELIPATGEDDRGSTKVLNLEQLAQLRDAVMKLPIKLREAVVLHYMQHLTIAEAAEAAGVGKGTLKSRLSRALGVLRRQLNSDL
jgi:RNA polymerase sigma-70 factor (ECF subfamily)